MDMQELNRSTQITRTNELPGAANLLIASEVTRQAPTGRREKEVWPAQIGR